MFGNFVRYFLYITVGIFGICGISYTIAGVETVTVDIFGMILLSAFATTLATVLIVPKENDGKVKACVKFILHYMVLCVIMSFLGIRFGWVDFDFAGIATMIMDVGFVYLFVFIAYYLIDRKQADEINEMLQEKYGGEES